ncbi:Ribosomal protein L15 [Thermoplasmatales archaeon BRNA1]|nr:Ribosomal protein L15 [Thermoplasmatales archaeon BRNA1]
MPSRTKKFRGKRTHGRGKKSGRGAGMIGGRGQSGLCKTGKIGMLKYDRDHWGRRGFKRPQSMVKANTTINVAELKKSMDRFVTSGFATQDGDKFTVNLTEAGIDKLLGSGNIDIAVDVTVAEVSAKAKEKIEAAGGSIAE